MKNEHAIILILAVFILFLVGKNDQINEKIKDMNQESKMLESKIQYLEFSNEKIDKMYKDSINKIESEIKSSKKSHIKELKRLQSLSAKEVKDELLKNIKIEKDLSKLSDITESQSKELLIEKRTLQYQVKKVGLENAKLGVDNNALKSINYNLNAIIENKNVQLNNSDEVIELIRKGNRNKLIKVGGVCIGLGIIVGLLL
jgi:hypothetical protein